MGRTVRLPSALLGSQGKEWKSISGFQDAMMESLREKAVSLQGLQCVGPMLYLPSLAVLGHGQIGLSQQTELLRDFALGGAEPLEEVREQLLHGRDTVLCTKCGPHRASSLMPWSSQRRD